MYNGRADFQNTLYRPTAKTILQPEKVMAGGRPTKYSQELADKICTIISTSSKSMATIAREVNIDMVTIFRWLDDSDEFRKQYTRAKELQADYLAEEMLDIADDTKGDTTKVKRNGKFEDVENTEWINRSKLRVETRKWIASKLKPKKYGDKTEHTIIAEKPIFNGIDLDVPQDNSTNKDS